MIHDYTKYSHRAGDVYQFGEFSAHYLLAMVEADQENARPDWVKFALINLATGNRWTEPVSFDIVEGHPYDAISDEELSALVGSYLIQKVPGQVTFVPLH